MKNYYDVHAEDATFEEGDTLQLHNPCKKIGHSPKLMQSWERPYIITKAINDIAHLDSCTTYYVGMMLFYQAVPEVWDAKD